jgi:hypothetical protein
MATPQQIAANRRNTPKSTGAYTPQGFTTVKPGLGTAERTWLQIYSQVLVSSFDRELRPVGPLEKLVFQQIAAASWRLPSNPNRALVFSLHPQAPAPPSPTKHSPTAIAAQRGTFRHPQHKKYKTNPIGKTPRAAQPSPAPSPQPPAPSLAMGFLGVFVAWW